MTKTIFETEAAPAAIGPYSQAVSCGGIVYCSGQLPVDAVTGTIANGIAEQTRAALQNLSEILQCSGSKLSAVLKTTVFMIDLAQFEMMNQVYGEFFKDAPPARSTIQVAKLPKGALIEIEAIAFSQKS